MLMLPLCGWVASHLLSLPLPNCVPPVVEALGYHSALSNLKFERASTKLVHDVFSHLGFTPPLTAANSCISIDRLTLRYGLSVDGVMTAPKPLYRLCHMRV